MIRHRIEFGVIQPYKDMGNILRIRIDKWYVFGILIYKHTTPRESWMMS
jgi:hypothetical protein